MANEPARRLQLGSILWYGLALGLLLASLQVAQYKFLFSDAAEWYAVLVAVMFTALGIWVGLRFTRPKKTAPPAAVEALSGEALEKVLVKLNITPREYEVLQLIAQGLSNQEIAGRMFLSLNTVKTHTSNLFIKLNVQRRTQAVQRAQSLGLLG